MTTRPNPRDKYDVAFWGLPGAEAEENQKEETASLRSARPSPRSGAYNGRKREIVRRGKGDPKEPPVGSLESAKTGGCGPHRLPTPA